MNEGTEEGGIYTMSNSGMLELGPESPVNKKDKGKHSIPAVQPGVINTDRNKTDYINSADFEAHYKAATSPVSI